MQRNRKPGQTFAMTALKLPGEGQGGVRRGAGKGAKSGHENLDHGPILAIMITQICFGPILVTFAVQYPCEQRGLLTFRQAVPCLMGAATGWVAAIPED
jgi:hypothetical protein